ncbi:MAG: hypothetical protein RLN88_00155 [Ekhidna sp.]|uniref:hypothetical protein n=1 Tax=Ekhidna sp. TaxID=2608089 RepID=UPI0032EC6EAC
MKKYIISLVVALTMIAAIPAYATPSETSGSTESGTTSDKAVLLIERLERIKDMDKSAMSPVEKRAIRKEVKSINKELKQLGGGVYMSVGAVIIILLLLIILL